MKVQHLAPCIWVAFYIKITSFPSSSCSRKTCYAHHVILSMFPPPLVLLDMCHGHRVPEQKMLRTEESQQNQAGRQAAPAGDEENCQSCPVTRRLLESGPLPPSPPMRVLPSLMEVCIQPDVARLLQGPERWGWGSGTQLEGISIPLCPIRSVE